jgi:hypothetical protein
MMTGCSGEKAQEAAVELTIAEFNANSKEFVGKTLVLTGTVDHVCKHGGKKMFIMGEDPEDRVKIEAGETGAFDVALEGSDVRVEGIVIEMRVDEAYLDNWEEESCSEDSKEIGKGVHAEGESADHDAEHQKEQDETLAKIEKLRKKLAECGEEYLGYYHLECVSFTELVQKETPKEG